MTTTRRKLLKLLAAGSAATLVAPVAPLARAAAVTRKPRATRVPAAKPAENAGAAPDVEVRAEIERQRRDVATALKTLRDHPLPPGSAPAFVFRPLAPERGRKGR